MGIEIKNFSYKYPLEDKNVLENLNLKIEKGEFWAVIGKNGRIITSLRVLISSLAKKEKKVVKIEVKEQ